MKAASTLTNNTSQNAERGSDLEDAEIAKTQSDSLLHSTEMFCCPSTDNQIYEMCLQQHGAEQTSTASDGTPA